MLSISISYFRLPTSRKMDATAPTFSVFDCNGWGTFCGAERLDNGIEAGGDLGRHLFLQVGNL